MAAKEGHTVTYMSPEEVQGVIDYVGAEIIASFEGAFPGGKPLVDSLIANLEEAK